MGQKKKGYLRNLRGLVITPSDGEPYLADSGQSAALTMNYSEGDEEELRSGGALRVYARDDDYLLNIELSFTNVRSDLELLEKIQGGTFTEPGEYEPDTILEQEQPIFRVDVIGRNYDEGSEIRDGFQSVVLPYAKGRFDSLTIEEGTFSTPEFTVLGFEGAEQDSVYKKLFFNSAVFSGSVVDDPDTASDLDNHRVNISPGVANVGHRFKKLNAEEDYILADSSGLSNVGDTVVHSLVIERANNTLQYNHVSSLVSASPDPLSDEELSNELDNDDWIRICDITVEVVSEGEVEQSYDNDVRPFYV